MNTSESIINISPALLKAQKAIKFAVKDSTNPHFRKKYADLSSVIEAIKQPLNDAGISFIQTPSPSQSGFLCLTTRLIHESGEWIEDTATMPLPKSDPQGFGSAMTYCRRYALAAFVGVYQDDDDGNAGSVVPPASAKPITKFVFDTLDEQSQDEIRSYAADIILMIHKNQADEAVEYINSLGLDADWKTALWSLLDSKQRAAIKKFTKG
jgi:hypothetical protein